MKALFTLRKLLLLALFLLFITPNTYGVSLHPDVIEKLKSEGRLDEVVAQMKSARERGADAGPKEPYRFTLSSGAASQDTFRIIVILVDFADNTWQDGMAAGSAQYFEDLLFSEDVMPYYSMKEYYLENSYGQFYLIGEVYGWYRMPNDYVYYVNGQAGSGSYPQNAQGLARDAVVMADADVDFDLYDNSGNGWVDGLLIVHAGEGRETSESDNDIHSHQWSIPNYVPVDDVKVSAYSIQPEENRNTADDLTTIGVFCHEFGHLAGGLPDLYDTDYSSEGVGAWSMMAGGSWNGGGARPSHFDAWCKWVFGFVDPVVIEQNEMNYEIPQVESSPYVVKLWKDGAPGLMYFLIENRQKTGSDATLPGEGLLIYHVDDTRYNNDDEEHYLVAVEQADGLLHLENNTNGGDNGDPFPGSSNNREFSDRTTPNSRGYVGTPTEVGVWDISDPDSVMTANLEVEFGRPYYSLSTMTFDDADGNDDGNLDLGETAEVYFSAENQWADGLDVVATLSLSDGRLTPVIGSLNLGTVTGGQMFDNEGSPLTFTIPSEMDTMKVEVYVTLTQTNDTEPAVFIGEVNVGGSKLLIVDDDNGSDYEDYYADALDSAGVTYDIWNKDSLGTPGDSQKVYPMIVWYTGDHRDTTLTSSDVTFLKDYIDHGGGLFLTGQDIAEHLSVTDPDFLNDYLHCDWDSNTTSTQWEARGQAASTIGADEIRCAIFDATSGAHNQTSSDYLIPENESDVNFRYHSSGHPCGLEIESDYSRVVFFSFGFEAVSDFYASQPDFVSRGELMKRVTDYLRGKQEAPNHPPSAFELASPNDAGTVVGNIVKFIWNASVDEDILDPITYTLKYSPIDTIPWDFVIENIVDTHYTVTGLEYDQTFYWTVIACDGHGAETYGDVYSFVTERDLVPPKFDIKMVMNPVIPTELDIYAYPNEPLEANPSFEAGTQSYTMSQPDDRSALVYYIDYRIDGSGSHSVSVCGTDVWGNYGCTNRDFSAAPLYAGADAILGSFNGMFSVAIKPNSVRGEALLLLFEEPVQGDELQYVALPDGFTPLASLHAKSSVSSLNFPALLSAHLTEIGMSREDMARAAFFRLADGIAERIPANLNQTTGVLTGEVSEFGTYLLGKLESAEDSDGDELLPTTYELHQNSPNPFNPSTSIAYDIPMEGHVRIDVYNILGQRVVRLVDEWKGIGSFEAYWDGKDGNGNGASSGVYFYRLETDGFVDTKRMVLLK